jgi:NHLM bacteriocin system ABC transporter ATP-binding protein
MGERTLRLFRDEGASVPSGANAPILLEGPESVWLVVAGKLDVFAVGVVDGKASGARDFLFSVPPGGLVPGVEAGWAGGVGLLAVGTPGTETLRLPVKRLHGSAPFAEVGPLLDDYVVAFSSALSHRGSPRLDVLLSPGEEACVEDGAAVSARHGVAWVRVERGTLLFDAMSSLSIGPEAGLFPLSSGAWAQASGASALRVLARDEALGDAEGVWDGLRGFQRAALEWAAAVLERDRGVAQERLRRRLAADEATHAAALASLTDVMRRAAPPPPEPGASAVLLACRSVGALLGLRFRVPPDLRRAAPTRADEVRAIAKASGIGQRRVVLSGPWWKHDNGPLLGFRAGESDEAVPVALVPDGPGRYEIADPASGSRRRVDAEVAAALAPFAYQFYRPLPARVLRVADLWRFVALGVWGDLRVLLAMGVLGAGLGLLLPILTGVVFDQVIPGSDRGQLLGVFVALAVAALAGAAFELTRAVAVIRLNAKVISALQMAVLDRLVRLPLPFFRGYAAGDLAQRAGGINLIGGALSGATATSLLSAMVSAGAWVLLFVYSVPLALLATAILLVSVGFAFLVGYRALRFTRALGEVEGRLQGVVLQFLTGIAKLRVSDTEARAFSRWAGHFRRQQELGYEVGRLHNGVGVFNSVLSIASTLLIYWGYTALPATGSGAMSTGAFLAFAAAFGLFITAGMTLTDTGIGLLRLVPVWERARPILATVPEQDPDRPDPGELTGRIEVNHLTFRYGPDGPLVLDDVSLHAEPGELIALVGPSGAGKSTLLRVLLAFDPPGGGFVYYDGHDLASVDVTAVRRQIGVVLQSSRLTSGDVYSNIVGASSLSVDEAWEAARMAGMEEDLRAMPMGMHTLVSEGGGTLSGGQRQRLLIARALVHRPRIIFFDEATSALDNRTQEIVSRSLGRLHATRVVVAHRISTIRGADRIYVLDRGRIVQSGAYERLRAEDGLFAELAARQEVHR